MKKGYFWLIGLGICLIALGWGLKPTKAATNNTAAETAVANNAHQFYGIQTQTTQQQGVGECDIYAVDLIGAWADAGQKTAVFPSPPSMTNPAPATSLLTSCLFSLKRTPGSKVPKPAPNASLITLKIPAMRWI